MEQLVRKYVMIPDLCIRNRRTVSSPTLTVVFSVGFSNKYLVLIPVYSHTQLTSISIILIRDVTVIAMSC